MEELGSLLIFKNFQSLRYGIYVSLGNFKEMLLARLKFTIDI